MAKYRKTALIEAEQWWKLGDGPEEGRAVTGCTLLGSYDCKRCGQPANGHGRIATLEGEHIVCPGDWVATGAQGEHWAIKPDIFEATYELVDA